MMLSSTKGMVAVALAAMAAPVLMGCTDPPEANQGAVTTSDNSGGGGGGGGGSSKQNTNTYTNVASSQWENVETVFTPQGDPCTSQHPVPVEGYPNNEYARRYSYCQQCVGFQFCARAAPGYTVAHNGVIWPLSEFTEGIGTLYCPANQELLYTESGGVFAGYGCKDVDGAPPGNGGGGTPVEDEECLVPFCSECNPDGSCSICESGYQKGLAPGPDGSGMYQYCLSTNPGCEASGWNSVGYLEHNLCAHVECLVPGCTSCSNGVHQCDNASSCAHGGKVEIREGPDGQKYRFCVDEDKTGHIGEQECEPYRWEKDNTNGPVIPFLTTPYHHPHCTEQA